MELYGEYVTTWSGTSFGIKEPLVRCRDCNSYEQRKYGSYCHRFSMFDSVGRPVEPSGFCAWGERITND